MIHLICFNVQNLIAHKVSGTLSDQVGVPAGTKRFLRVHTLFFRVGFGVKVGVWHPAVSVEEQARDA